MRSRARTPTPCCGPPIVPCSVSVQSLHLCRRRNHTSPFAVHPWSNHLNPSPRSRRRWRQPRVGHARQGLVLSFPGWTRARQQTAGHSSRHRRRRLTGSLGLIPGATAHPALLRERRVQFDVCRWLPATSALDAGARPPVFRVVVTHCWPFWRSDTADNSRAIFS
jgi:hypothetical protein